MNPYTNIGEIDAYLKVRLQSLPPELHAAATNNQLYDTLEGFLLNYHLSPEIVAGIKHELFLILVRLIPQEEFLANLMTEYNLNIPTAVAISQAVEQKILPPYTHLLTNLSDDEAELPLAAPAPTAAVPVPPPVPMPTAAPDISERLELEPQPGAVAPLPPTPPAVPVQPAAAPQVGYGSPRPLTREEVESSLSSHRTMAEDIEAVQHPSAPPAADPNQVPVPQYSKPFNGQS